jgi:hypothetical protein
MRGKVTGLMDTYKLYLKYLRYSVAATPTGEGDAAIPCFPSLIVKGLLAGGQPVGLFHPSGSLHPPRGGRDQTSPCYWAYYSYFIRVLGFLFLELEYI